MRKWALWIDPRTKLLLLLFCVLSTMVAPSIYYNFALILITVCVGLLCARPRFVFLGLVGYMVLWALTTLVISMPQNTFQIMMVAFLGLLHKIYPCSIMSGVVIPTTKISEFLAAMNRMKAPDSLVIPFAVMLRYIPTIQEDWRFIKDAMCMRDVSPSLKGFLTRPAMTTECIYVPLMMAASKAADELTIASVTRGIENPAPRTCLVQIKLGAPDYILIICFLAFFIVGCVI